MQSLSRCFSSLTTTPLSRFTSLSRPCLSRSVRRTPPPSLHLSRPLGLGGGGRCPFHSSAVAGRKESIVAEDDDDEDLSGEESYDEDEPDHPRKWSSIDEPFDLEHITKVVAELRGFDLCVIDTAEKVDWVRYQVFISGRNRAHIKRMSQVLLTDLKRRRSDRGWQLDQADSEFWVILNTGDMIIHFWTPEEREEYDIERTWILRRNERNPFAKDFDEVAETKWTYDEEDGMEEEEEEDPDVEKLKGW